MQVKFDGIDAVSIDLSEIYMDQTCGLCGNFDHDYTNDLSLAPFSSDQAETPIQLGNQMVAPANLDFNAICEPVPDDANESCDKLQSLSPLEYRSIVDTCEMLMGERFQRCHDTVRVQKFIDICKQSLCTCKIRGNTVCEACQSFSMYSRECARRGVTLSWRTKEMCRK